MANLNDFAKRFRLGVSSASPFTSLGLEWCPRCKTEVDTETQTHHHDRTYGYKRWCRRCGYVVKYGVFDNVPILSRPTPPDALAWVKAEGEDRR